jgi:phosphoenolpyruvate carboxylase
MFLRVVMVPQFSRANDIAREDVLEMVFTLRIDDALAQLRAPSRPASQPGRFPGG